MAKKGVVDYTKSASLGKAVVAACIAAANLRGEAIYRGYRPGPILDLDRLLASGAVDEDESGMLLGRPNAHDAITNLKPLRGPELLTAKNLYRSITVEFLGFRVLVEVRGSRREDPSAIVDWRIHAVRPDACDPMGEDLFPDKQSFSQN